MTSRSSNESVAGTVMLLAQVGGLGNPLVVLLFPILFAILVGGPLLALAGIALAVWRRRSPVAGARIPRWLGFYALAVNTAFIAYMLATREFPAGAVFEWPARTAMVVGLLAMALGVRPLLAAPEARRRGAAWVVVMVALVGAALVTEREGWRRQIREDLFDAARDGDAAAVQVALDGGVDEATRVQMLDRAATHWEVSRPRVIELLLRAGTNPNARDKNGVSPWQSVMRHWLPDAQRGETIRLFLAHGADPNASWDGATPASIAWAKGDAELLGQLRVAGARDADTHEPRFRSLVDAVRAGDLATVRALRAAGVPWTHDGTGGRDMPITAGEEGRTDVLRLFASGSGYQCSDTDAALLGAARRGHQETVAFLLTTCLTLQGIDAATDAAEKAGHMEIGRLLRALPREYVHLPTTPSSPK